MAEIAFKKRLGRAKSNARKILINSDYEVTDLKNSIFHFEAAREREIRKIKVCVDKIDEEDIVKIKNIKLPTVCSKEIWRRKKEKKEFEIIEIN